MIPWGSLVVYVSPRNRRYIRRLLPGDDWQSTDGILSADTVANLDFGLEAHTHTGVPILIQEATLFDLLQGIKRQTQIIYAKDIAAICLKLGAGPNKTIVEAGCGSGGLTLALSHFVGPTGKVLSFDARPEFLKLARRNLDWAGLGSNVELIERDIANGFDVQGADALFLDVRTPWLYIEQALAAVKHGATLGFLVPTIDQVEKLLLAFETRNVSEIEVFELLKRNWKPVADRLRPNDRMTAHTGFLIFCREQFVSEEFRNFKPKGTRERKQEAARQERLAAYKSQNPSISDANSGDPGDFGENPAPSADFDQSQV
ncbi:MAG: tRNA (adenine-N1)-methyltransferase [Desulfovibrionaceae bacterium]|nr:tRNA (adenine-N1)-methyltransferase [Desulfovibrionaceae bacterium]